MVFKNFVLMVLLVLMSTSALADDEFMNLQARTEFCTSAGYKYQDSTVTTFEFKQGFVQKLVNQVSSLLHTETKSPGLLSITIKCKDIDDSGQQSLVAVLRHTSGDFERGTFDLSLSVVDINGYKSTTTGTFKYAPAIDSDPETTIDASKVEVLNLTKKVEPFTYFAVGPNIVHDLDGVLGRGDSATPPPALHDHEFVR